MTSGNMSRAPVSSFLRLYCRKITRRRCQTVFTNETLGSVVSGVPRQSYRCAIMPCISADPICRIHRSTTVTPDGNSNQGVYPLRLGQHRLYCSDSLSEAKYEELAEETLEHLSEKFDDIGETVQCDKEYDVAYGSGVLTVKISEEWGTYVINKQTPNKQIWLSSPISGPKRYDYVRGRWIYKHNGEVMLQLLEKEISEALGPKRYDYVRGRWIYKHNGEVMLQLLEKEISEALSTRIDFTDCQLDITHT